MQREIREKRNKLKKDWVALRTFAIDKTNKNAYKTRKTEEATYKKWKFYDEMIKRLEK
jgi:hypothetical protein